jgi:hypothetical protein
MATQRPPPEVESTQRALRTGEAEHLVVLRSRNPDHQTRLHPSNNRLREMQVPPRKKESAPYSTNAQVLVKSEPPFIHEIIQMKRRGWFSVGVVLVSLLSDKDNYRLAWDTEEKLKRLKMRLSLDSHWLDGSLSGVDCRSQGVRYGSEGSVAQRSGMNRR